MKEPQHSCPDINKLQRGLMNGIAELNYVETDGLDANAIEKVIKSMQDAIEDMELLRNINGELRDYAWHWKQEYDNQLMQIDNLEQVVELLTRERNDLQAKVDSLEMEVLQLNQL